MDAYRVRDTDRDAATRAASRFGVGPVVAQLLLQRGVADEQSARDFLDPRLSQMSDPSAMVDRREAGARIARAIKERQTIVVFGDYDADGTTSAAILSDIIEALGGNVKGLVANRFEGGYGFSDPALDRCLRESPDLIVTCDCGSADAPRIARAKERGVDVVVVDHHLVPKEPLPADAFLNPHRPDCGFAFKGMCSAGLVFSLGAEVRKQVGADLDIRPWLDLVAIGTVGDVAPLEGDNRAIVRAGLRILSSHRVRPGVEALRDRAKLRPGAPIGATDIGFKLAPRLNAPGRLSDPTVTLELLRAKTLEEARKLAARVEELNDERKAVERACTEEAIAQVEEIYGSRPENGVVLAGHGWHRGVVGISAARVVDRFGVPAVVIGLDGDKGHGSGRTPEGFHLHEALTKCSHLLGRFGGHAAAAGLTMDAGKIDALRSAFSEVAPRPEEANKAPWVDVELDEKWPLPSVRDLLMLEPVGEGNPRPTFALRDCRVADARVIGDGQHLKLKVVHRDRAINAFAPFMAAEIDRIGDRVTLGGSLAPDLYRGGENLELGVKHIFA